MLKKFISIQLNHLKTGPQFKWFARLDGFKYEHNFYYSTRGSQRGKLCLKN